MIINACCVSRIDAFLKSDHNRCASKLLAAYTDGDVDEIKKVAQSSTVSHLDHAVSDFSLYVVFLLKCEYIDGEYNLAI